MECVALECWRRTVLLSEFSDRLTITFKKAGSYRELLVTSDNRHFSYSLCIIKCCLNLLSSFHSICKITIFKILIPVLERFIFTFGA